MADGTSVGAVYLDLVLRDTIGKQLTSIAQRATAQANAAFSKTGAAAGSSFSQAFSKGFSRSLENAKAKLASLEAKQQRVGQQMDDWRETTKGMFEGVRNPGQAAQNFLDTDRGFQALAAQNDALLQKIEDAQARVAAEAQALAEKQAQAAEKARAREAAAAQKSAATQEREAHRAAAAQENAANRAAESHEQAAQRAQNAWDGVSAGSDGAGGLGGMLKSGLSGGLSLLKRGASGLGGIFSKVFSGAGKLVSGLAGKIKGLAAHFAGAGKSASHFGTRLRSIVTGALFFNLISSGLRSLTQSFGQAIASTSQMQGALANLKGAAANAAAPLVQILAPALAKIANAAATVFSYIAKLISLFTGKTISGAKGAASAIGGVGSAAGGASKKLKGYLLGMDELNVLQEDAAAGGGGGGGAGDILPNYDFEGSSPFLDSVLAAIQAGDYYKVGQLFAQKLNESLEAIDWAPIQEKAARWASNLATALNSFVEDPKVWQNIGHTLAQGLNTALIFIDDFVQQFHWDSLGKGLGNGLNKLFEELDWVRLGRLLTNKFKILFETLHGFLQTFDWVAFGHDIAAMLIAAANNINWVQAAADLGNLALGLLAAINTAITDIDWGSVGQTIWNMIAAIDWGSLLQQLIVALGNLILTIPTALYGFFDGMAQSLDAYLSAKFDAIGQDGILGLLAGMWSILCDLATWLYDHLIEPLLTFIADALGIHSPSTVFFDFGVNLVQGLFNGLSSIWNKITGFFSEKLDDIKKKVGDAWTNIKDNTSEVFNKVKETIADIWENGIVGKIKGAVNSILGFMNRLLAGAADMVNGLIDVLNSFKVDVPKGVPLIGGTSFGFSIPHVSAPQIPLLAKGGVIEQPTLAMMGEYAGAGQNPEVAAPQSLLREVFGESVAPLADAIRELLAVLRDALDSGETQPIELYIGDELLDRLIVSSNNRRALRTGGR